MGRLFGTDGARGIANTELSCELALQIGRALAMTLDIPIKNSRPQFLIGQDTRASSPMLANALAAGLNSAGADVILVGVVPTPAVAQLIPRWGCHGGAMVSASHNPCEFNGIKLFRALGSKLSDQAEEAIENTILQATDLSPIVIGGDIGRCMAGESAITDYLRHLRSTVPATLSSALRAQGMAKIALDCSNGSASITAPRLFSDLGFAYDLLSANPDGVNINANCGSTHMEQLQEHVRARSEIAAGFAFDGDADRLLAVDENGELVDGDKIIAICARQMKLDAVVVTVMTNMGFHVFCDKHGIAREITTVGDRYVLERMLEKDIGLGGEQSGHIIFSEYASTGDGQLTALQLLEVVRRSGKSLGELAADIEVFPQVMVNVQVSKLGKLRCESDPEIRLSVARAEAELGAQGRVLVRVSGTEPLIRIMLEGRDAARIQVLANEIAAVVRERLI